MFINPLPMWYKYDNRYVTSDQVLCTRYKYDNRYVTSDQVLCTRYFCITLDLQPGN